MQASTAFEGDSVFARLRNVKNSTDPVSCTVFETESKLTLSLQWASQRTVLKFASSSAERRRDIITKKRSFDIY